MWFRLIPNQRCIFSSVLPWVSNAGFHRPKAVLYFMSRDMKTKQRQNKYFTFPRKLTHKPLLHTTVCKVQSTHQEGTKPWAHTLLGQKPTECTLKLLPLKAILLEQRLTPIQETSLSSPTFTPGSIPQATCTCLLVFLLSFAGKLLQIQQDNMWTTWVFFSISSHLFKQMPADSFIAVLAWLLQTEITPVTNWGFFLVQFHLSEHA